MDKKILNKMTIAWQEWRYPPEKKQKKKKKVLKESAPGYENREFGDPLPTLEDIAAAYADDDEYDDELDEASIEFYDAQDQFQKALKSGRLKLKTASGRGEYILYTGDEKSIKVQVIGFE